MGGNGVWGGVLWWEVFVFPVVCGHLRSLVVADAEGGVEVAR